MGSTAEVVLEFVLNDLKWPLDSIKVKTMRTPLKQMPHSNSPAAVTPPGTLVKGASVTPGGRLRVATPARRAAERESGDVVLEKVGPGRLRVCTPLKAL